MDPEDRRIKDVLFLTCESFKIVGIEEAEKEAVFLISHYVGCKPAKLRLKGEDVITEAQYRNLSYAIRRRFKYEPIQYIIGEQEFYGHKFKVRPGVLIPRPETELLVDEVKGALKDARKKGRPPLILDLCTGSGALAVTLAKEISKAALIATDISKDAIEIAKENASSLGVSKRIEFLSGDLFGALKDYKPNTKIKKGFELDGDSLKGAFDFIVSNPPYVSTSEYKELSPEIKDHEPKEALVAGPDGLKYIKKIVKGASTWLKPGGMLMIEVGFDHAKDVKALIKETGSFKGIKHSNDLQRIARVVKATLS